MTQLKWWNRFNVCKNEPKPVEQFQREAQVLTRLHHPGVPQAEESFTFYPNNSQEPVYCLVMEKIEGENLEKWLENRDNCPINEKLALAQLAEIEQTLYPRKLSNTTSSQVVHTPNKPNITLERTICSWDSEHFKPVGCLAISPDGELLVSGNRNAIKAWILKTGTEIYTVTEHRNSVFSLAISLDGQYLISGGNDGSIKVWKLSTGERIRNFEDNHGSVYSIAITPDGKKLISGTQGGFTTLWNLDTGEKIRTIFKHSNTFVRCVAISSDGNTIVSADANGIIQILPRCGFKGHSRCINSVVITPDGECLISGSYDKRIKIWSLITGEEIDTLNSHVGSVKSLAVSPSGDLLVSGGADKTIKLWDLNTRKEVHTITGHLNDVNDLVFSPDGQFLVSGSEDCTIKVWRIQ